MSVITGKVAFANLTEHESFNGQSTGKYSVVLSLDEDEAQKLQNEGIKIKTYKNQPQRKFATQYDNFTVVDVDDEPLARSAIRWGDTVRVKYSVSKPHPVHGSAPYLEKIRLIEKAEREDYDDSEF